MRIHARSYGVVCLLVARFASGLSVGCIQLLMPAYVLDILKCVEAAGRSARMEAPLATTTPAADSTSPMTVFASATFHLQFLLGVLTIFVTGESFFTLGWVLRCVISRKPCNVNTCMSAGVGERLWYCHLKMKWNVH